MEKFTRFERARIIGARALQISMGAPILLKPEELPAVDPVLVAEMEYAKGIIPITVVKGTARRIRGTQSTTSAATAAR